MIAIVRGERDILAGERTNIFAQLDKINKEVYQIGPMFKMGTNIKIFCRFPKRPSLFKN